MSGQHKPRIRRAGGQWYAFGKPSKQGRLLLVSAINFVCWLNARAARAS